MTVEEAIKHLQGYDPKQEIAITIWGPDDVFEQARSMGVALTDEQVSSVLYYLNDKHDANCGINWDVIGCAISIVLREDNLVLANKKTE